MLITWMHRVMHGFFVKSLKPMVPGVSKAESLTSYKKTTGRLHPSYSPMATRSRAISLLIVAAFMVCSSTKPSVWALTITAIGSPATGPSPFKRKVPGRPGRIRVRSRIRLAGSGRSHFNTALAMASCSAANTTQRTRPFTGYVRILRVMNAPIQD